MERIGIDLDRGSVRLKKSSGQISGRILIYDNSTTPRTILSNHTYTLSTQRARHNAAQEISSMYDLEPEDVLTVFNTLSNLALEITNQFEAPVATAVEIPEERRKAALQLLSQPNLMHHILSILGRGGLVGEQANALTVYLAATSRLLSGPFNLMVSGVSSSGKSSVAWMVSLLFPPEAIIVRFGMSSKAALYSKDSWEHKAIFFLELPGMQDGLDVYRVIQSEGVVPYEVTVKDEKTGEWGTKVFNKIGPTAFIVTTVETALNEQDETRYWRAFTDDSPLQTYRVTESMYLNHSNVPSDEEYQQLHDIQRLLVDTQVAISRDLLEPISKWVRSTYGDAVQPRFRRDWKRLVSVMASSAVLHQYQRERDDQGRIIPTLADYYYAWKIAAKIFAESMVGFADSSKQLFEKLAQRNKDAGLKDNSEYVTQSDLVQITKWSQSKVSRALAPLVEKGYVLEKSGGFNNSKKYVLGYAGTSIFLPEPIVLIKLNPRLLEDLPSCIDPITGEQVSFI